MEVRGRKSAKHYYSDPLLSNLLEAVFKKYRGQNGVRGHATIRVVSDAEAARLQEFFGNRLEQWIRPGVEVEVHLKVFAEEIALGYELDIPELYEVLYEMPLVTNAEKRQLRDTAWYGLFEKVESRFLSHMKNSAYNEIMSERTFGWFKRLNSGQAAGYRIVQHAMRKGNDPTRILFHCLKALWYLFVENEKMLVDMGSHVPWVRLPMLSEYITEGDPHAFDWKMPAGRLLWYALYDINNKHIKSGQKTANDHLLVSDLMKRRYIYRDSGIMADDISSYLHVFVPNELYGTTARTWNLSELLSRQDWFRPSDLYVLENPSVFSFLVDETIHFMETNGITKEQIPDNFPALMCTSGQARDAVKYFIYQYTENNSECIIHYSGDFDLPGVQMQMKMEKLGKVELFRMDSVTYKKHIHSRNLSLSEQDIKILEEMESDLSRTMVEERRKVYQEAITKELREDWIEVIKDSLSSYILKS
ncbi:TIGR02679 domain-containing protein [Cohnella sp.]|uniref:TIGR02679 domain-containing protein n=1 Tax=Cohnella sp. TaxID=1883426 RepID=UPI0037049EE6